LSTRTPSENQAKSSSELVHEICAGEQVDGFEVGELYHEGGMAQVYHVRHPRHPLPMLMKVPKLGPQAPLSSYTAFENELRILKRLHGPHVPRFIAAGDLMKNPYLVIEYIEGDELVEAVKQEAPLSLERVCDHGIRLARAVHELHRQHVIHLDINPGNIRNRSNGQIVLVDFGLAHHAAMPDLIDFSYGEEEGTTPYIAPEQVKHLRNDARSDIYAIGVILYLLASGHYPFGRPNLLSLKKRLFQVPSPPRNHNPDIPAWLQEVILHCLEIHPDDRYPTAKQVAHALAHPESVHLSRRAHRRRQPGWLTRTGLWFRSLYQVFDEGEPLHPHARLSNAPHVLVALDLDHASESLKAALRTAVRKYARNESHSYFTFLSIMPEDEAYLEVGEENPAQHAASVARLVAMRNWVQPLRLPASRAYFQISVGHPANAIVEYARHHVVDYIIMGARGSSTVRRFLGSVSAKVVAEAPCSVTVVRSRRDPGVAVDTETG